MQLFENFLLASSMGYTPASARTACIELCASSIGSWKFQIVKPVWMCRGWKLVNPISLRAITKTLFHETFDTIWTILSGSKFVQIIRSPPYNIYSLSTRNWEFDYPMRIYQKKKGLGRIFMAHGIHGKMMTDILHNNIVEQSNREISHFHTKLRAFLHYADDEVGVRSK